MLKRIILFVFVLCALVVLALVPMNVNAGPQTTAKLQETVVVAVVTAAGPASSGPAATGMPMSTLIIFGLLVILGVAVVIGGMALMRPRE